MALASHESFSLDQTFADPRGVCAAIVDRLTLGGNIHRAGTTSYRLAHTLAQRNAGWTGQHSTWIDWRCLLDHCKTSFASLHGIGVETAIAAERRSEGGRQRS